MMNFRNLEEPLMPDGLSNAGLVRRLAEKVRHSDEYAFCMDCYHLCRRMPGFETPWVHAGYSVRYGVYRFNVECRQDTSIFTCDCKKPVPIPRYNREAWIAELANAHKDNPYYEVAMREVLGMIDRVSG